MVLRNPLDLPRTGRLLALDMGEKRVGVAISDSLRTVALGRGQWPRPWRELKTLLDNERQTSSLCAVVLGLPLNMDGTHGPMAQSVSDLAALIEKELNLPALLWDERLTSRQMEQSFFEERTGRQTRAGKKDSIGKMDSGAAVLILQGVLGALR